MRDRSAFMEEDTQAVIFDLGNVLLGYDWKPYLSSLDMTRRQRSSWLMLFSAVRTGRGETRGASPHRNGSSFLLITLPTTRHRSAGCTAG